MQDDAQPGPPAAPPPVRRRIVKLVVRGESAQAALSRVEPGVPVVLAMERDGEASAITVRLEDGTAIGVLPAADAATFAPFVGTEALSGATLHQLAGGTAAHPGHEAWVGLRWAGQQARAPLPLTADQRAWRSGEPVASPAAGTLAGRVQAFAAGYARGELTWKATLVGIALSTLVSTAVLIVLG